MLLIDATSTKSTATREVQPTRPLRQDSKGENNDIRTDLPYGRGCVKSRVPKR